MGSNQSKANGAGSSRSFVCCGGRDSIDSSPNLPQKRLHISNGQILPANSVAIEESSQPAQRIDMTDHSRTNLHLLSDAKADLNVTLPTNKRLSPLPDFSNINSETVTKIAAEPWVAVRKIAESTPSRRSSFLDPSGSGKPDHQIAKTIDHSAQPSSLSSTPVKPKVRPRSKSSPAENRTTARARSPRLRLQTDIRVEGPRPSLISSFSSQQPTQGRRSASLKRKTSLRQRARSHTASSPDSGKRSRSVENAVRELEEIVHAKREVTAADDESPSGGALSSVKGSVKAHRPAIAPNMIMQDVSSTLLDEIGSGLSRPLSGSSTSSPVPLLAPMSPLSSVRLSGLSKRRSARRESSWPGTVTTAGNSPRHSGTFFFSRQSLDEITGRAIASRLKSSNHAVDTGDSPVDRQWSDENVLSAAAARAEQGTLDKAKGSVARQPQRPAPARVSSAGTVLSQEGVYTAKADSATAKRHDPSFTPFHRRNISSASASTTATGISLSSNLFPETPTSRVPTMPAKVKLTVFPQPPKKVSASRKEVETTSKPNEVPERTPSRVDSSSAVQAARQRAATRIAAEEAAGMGLGIGGMLSAQELSDIVEMDVWNAKPAHQHPSRSRLESGDTLRTDSILVEPSLSPNVTVHDGKNGGLEKVMSVSVPKGHVAQLIRTQSGKTVVKARKESTDKTKKEADRPRPLAGAPRKLSKESNTPTARPPSQNEARTRRQPNKSQDAPRSRSRSTTARSRQPTDSTMEHEYRGSAHIVPRSRSNSAASFYSHTSRQAEGADFGIDLQISATARRLQEVEAHLERVEREKKEEEEKQQRLKAPPSPANIGSPMSGKKEGLGVPSSGREGVRISQVGMAL